MYALISKISNFDAVGDGSIKGNAGKVGKIGKISNFGAVGKIGKISNVGAVGDGSIKGSFNNATILPPYE